MSTQSVDWRSLAYVTASHHSVSVPTAPRGRPTAPPPPAFPSSPAQSCADSLSVCSQLWEHSGACRITEGGRAKRSVSLSPGHGSVAGQLEWCRSLLLPGPTPGQEEEEKTLRAQRWILNCVGRGWFSSCSCLIAELILSCSFSLCNRLEKLLCSS